MRGGEAGGGGMIYALMLCSGMALGCELSADMPDRASCIAAAAQANQNMHKPVQWTPEELEAARRFQANNPGYNPHFVCMARPEPAPQ
jgi:hypothetical protein